MGKGGRGEGEKWGKWGNLSEEEWTDSNDVGKGGRREVGVGE